jgi:hypothetical protein
MMDAIGIPMAVAAFSNHLPASFADGALGVLIA